MNKDIFWDVFRDTGDPLCWLLTRLEDCTRQSGSDTNGIQMTDGEEQNGSSPRR